MPQFARAVTDAGLTWIGPSALAIEVMGSKIESKRLMAAADVPTLEELDPSTVTVEDLPVLIKASAGGGGRGMRIVRSLSELSGEVELARLEAQSAFGDPTVFCEPFLETGRHIEVQVMADEHGAVWTVGERECSIQRRHQKVIEEAPSPLVDRIEGMRKRLFDAAGAAARAVEYSGAGTVEFIADERGRFFFLEMNTRLQVEHPVTECTTGLDLVALQLHVAQGGRLEAQPPPAFGHSIEARLYAEDPSKGWQPQSGTVRRFSMPGAPVAFQTGTTEVGLRVDSGVEDGTVVGIHYDPMLAKVVSWAPSREQAAMVLARGLARAQIHGLVTNRDLLVATLRHPSFLAGDTDTAFFDRHGLDQLARSPVEGSSLLFSAVAAAMALEQEAIEDSPVLYGVPAGWRNVVSVPQKVTFIELEVEYHRLRNSVVIDGMPGLLVAAESSTRVVLEIDEIRHSFDVARYGNQVEVDSALGPVRLHLVEALVDPSSQAADGSLMAPMPGTVVRLGVAPGDAVSAGQPVLWLEAMKMQHVIAAPSDGVVTALYAGEGQQVEVGALLALIAADGEGD